MKAAPTALLLVLGVALVALWIPGVVTPDGQAYHLAGRRLVEIGTMRMPVPDVYEWVGRHWIPGERSSILRLAPGFPMMIALGELLREGAGMWVTPVSAWVAVALMWRVGAQLGLGRWTLGAMLLVALNPVLSRLAFTQFAHSLNVALLLGVLSLALDRRAMAAGVLLGLATAVRVPDAVLVLPLVVALAGGTTGPLRAVAAGLGFGLGVLPLLAWNALNFGDPLATGYGVSGELEDGLSLAHLAGQLPLVIRTFVVEGIGLGVLGLFALRGLGVFRGGALVLAVALPLGLHASWYWWSEAAAAYQVRFLALLVPLVALGFVAALRRFPAWLALPLLGLQLGWSAWKSVDQVDAQHGLMRAQLELRETLRGRVPEGAVLMTTEYEANLLSLERRWRIWPIELLDLEALVTREQRREGRGVSTQLIARERAWRQDPDHLEKLERALRAAEPSGVFLVGRSLPQSAPGRVVQEVPLGKRRLRQIGF